MFRSVVKNCGGTIIEAMGGKNQTVKIPVRSGEKFHESLISKDEIRKTYETKEDYILFDTKQPFIDSSFVTKFKKTDLKDEYSSDKVDLLNKEELKKILLEENLIPDTKK